MSSRITRSKTISAEKAPVYLFPVNRKSSSTRKSGQPLTPITNRLPPDKSASKERSSESEKTKNVQVVTNIRPPLEKHSAAAERKTHSNVERNSSAIDLHENRNAPERFTDITWNSSRIMTRSLSVLLAKVPVNMGRRKSEPAKIFNQHLSNQLTPKKCTTKAPTTSSSSIETSSASKKSQPAANAKALLNDMITSTTAITSNTSRKMTRSHSVLLAKVPVNIGGRKSEPPNQNLANQLTLKKSTTKAPTTPRISKETSTASKKSQTSAKAKTSLNDMTTSTTAIISNTSRRMTRSYSVLLAKDPVYIGGRKSEPAKILNQNRSNQLTSKKSTTKALHTPRTSPERSTASKISQTAAKAKTVLNDMTGTARTDDNVNIFASDSCADETQPIPSTSLKATCVLPQRKTRSQPVSLAKAPVNIGKRKSESAKKRNQNLAKQLTPKNSITKVVTTPPTSPTGAAEVTIETSNASNKSKSVAKAKSVSEDDPGIETISVEECMPTTRPEDNGNVSENVSQPEEAELIASNSSLQLISDTAVSPTSNIRLRRSTRSTKGVIPKRHEDITRKVDSSSAARPVKVARRRHTVNSLQFTSDEVVANASIDDQGTSSANITNITMNTKPALRKEKSTADMNANSKIGENVSIASTDNQGISTNPSNTKSADTSAKTNRTLASSTKIKNKEIEAAFIKIPDSLRQILIDDSKFINTSKRLYNIPSDFNVAELVDEYVATVVENEASSSWNPSPLSCSILFKGIIEYFDTLIGRQLLYEPERNQYNLMMNNFPGVAMSKIYPPIYLLRLLVQLNKLLRYSNTSEEIMKVSMEHLYKFVNYLTDNKATLFNPSC